MNLDQARLLAQTLINKHLDDSWSFAWTNSNRVYGRCDYTRRQIQLSKLITEHRPEHKVKQTILHEIAHALTPGCKHNTTWKTVARNLGVINPRSTAPIDFERSNLPYTWGMYHGDELIRGYFRKPGKNTFENLRYYSIKGRPETKGQLRIVQM
jgi:predicted SprT family Zn-dependent metalloprotease